jgi:HD-like signal output (HDOD) protein
LVAKGTPYERDAFTLGLLLDVGQLAIAMTNCKKWRACRNRAEREDLPLVDLEQEAFGVSHAAVGAYLLGIWGLPFHVVEAVAWHHHPEVGRRAGLSPPSIATLAVSLITQVPMDDEWLDVVGVKARVPCWRETLGL